MKENTNITEETTGSIHQIYDKTMKKILTLSPGAIINLINGLFHTEYPLDSSITYNWTEHHDDDLKRTLADTILTINGEHAYHIEAQMSKDEEIEFRVFDYGYKHALTVRSGTDTLCFPEPQIIFLYNAENLPDEKIIHLDFGTQGTFSYHVPIYKLLDHSMQELDEKKMVILIPFFLLKLRKQLEKNRSIKSMNALKSLIFDDILGLIQKNQAEGNITAADSYRLRNMIQKLYMHLYSQYEEFKEGGLNTMMEDGLVLETDIIEAEITKRVTAKLTAELTESLTAEITENLTAKITENLTAEITENLTAKITENLTAEITTQVTEDVTKRITEEERLATIRQLYSKLNDVNQVADLLDLPLESVQSAL